MKNAVTVYEVVDEEDKSNVLYGTLEDVRQFAKDRWNECNMQDDEYSYFEEVDGEQVEKTFEFEEDYYTFLDDDKNLIGFLSDRWTYKVNPICEVSIEDFVE